MGENICNQYLIARRSNQSILKEINPECLLEGLMLKLKLLYFGTGKDPDAGWQKEKGQQRMRWFDSIRNSMEMNLSKLQETVEDKGAWHAAVQGVTRSLTRLGD